MLVVPARCFCAASPGFTVKLLLTDEGERGAEPFFLDNRTLVDHSDLVERAIGKLDAAIADRQPTVGIINDSDPLGQKAAEIDIFKLDGTDICTLRLHAGTLI